MQNATDDKKLVTTFEKVNSKNTHIVTPAIHFMTTGRYAINRIIMEGDNIPPLSQNGPYFDMSKRGNISVVTGNIARLKCQVHNLGDKTVRFALFKCSL